MPVIFEQMPFGQILGTMWFLLLFFAGITSSVGLCQPMIAFHAGSLWLEPTSKWSFVRRRPSCTWLSYYFVFGNGYLDEYDNWVGTVGLILFGLIETILFAWIFGYSKMREEMTRGQQLRIPEVFYPLIRYVVPIF